MKSGKILAGWSCVDLTPAEKVLIIGQFYPRISKKVISPLTATALALETRDNNGASIDQSVFLSCDFTVVDQEIFVSGGLPEKVFKDKLVGELKTRCLDLNLSKLTINATHTHNAPVFVKGFFPELDGKDFMAPLKYQAFLISKLADVVCEAWNSRRPSGVSRGFEYAKVACCRRALYDSGRTKMYAETARDDFVGLENFEDHSVNLLFTWNESGNLSGIVCNLACPAQVDELGNFISSDFWHDIRMGVEKRFGKHVCLLAQCSAAGDVSPHPMINKIEEKYERKKRNLSRKQIIAKRVLFAIECAMHGSRKFVQTEAVMKHEVMKLVLPLRMVTDEEYEDFKKNRKEFPTGLIGNLAARREYQKKKKEAVFESHIIRIADTVTVTNSFELFTDWGVVIKARSKAAQTFIVQLSDAYSFYLPSEKAVHNGDFGAEIGLNWVGPDGGRKLADMTVEAVGDQFPEIKGFPHITVKPNFQGSRREKSAPY